MSNKTIQLNPVFLSTSASKAKIASASSTKTLKREKPIMPNSALIKPNKVKKQLLAKIKDFQVIVEERGLTHEESKKQQAEEFDKGFSDEFNKSLNFLQELSKQKGEQHQQKKEHKNTLKRGKIENQVHMQIATELPMELRMATPTPQAPPPPYIATPQRQAPQIQMPPIQMPIQYIQPQIQLPQPQQQPQPLPPPYGILKQGTKPTYRQWHNTTQKLHYPANESKPLIKIDRGDDAMAAPTATFSPPQLNVGVNLPVPQAELSSTQMAAEVSVPSVAALTEARVAQLPPPSKRRITKTTKYKLGKTKGSNKVSVLIKNNQTRKKVQHEIGLLKQKPIMDIKNHLREKNLLKVGSFAPNDVLRQIYEQSILAGDVENKSKDTLIHNFYNDKSK
jgi:hypothetical protein